MFTRIAGSGVAEENPKPGIDAAPRCFALAPLYTHPVTRQADVRILDADGTLGDATVAAMFTDIDVELWARQFLGDLDRFLAAFASPDLDGQSAAGAMLARAVESKHAIASAIADQLKGVFDYSPCETDCDPDYRKSLQAARDTLAHQLQVGLIKGYDIPVMVQYDSGVSAAASEPEHHGLVPGSVDAAAHSPAPPRSAESSLVARTETPRDTARTSVPLRFQPAPPVLVEQTAAPTFDLPIDLQQLPLWTYKLVLTHEFAAQDRAIVTTEFNLMRRPSPAPAPCFDLFDVLAQYTAVADRLWMLLSRTPGLPSGRDSSLANAAGTFADLAALVAAHWRIRLPQDKGCDMPESDYVAGTSHAFGVRVAYSEHGGGIESVSFVRERPPADPGQGWPEVDVLLPDGSSVALVAPPADPSSLAAVYVPKHGVVVPAFAWQTFRLTWSGLNVSACQNARSRASVVRNEDLAYDPLHPENATRATNPAFVFRTAEVVPGSSVAPLIERRHPQEISGANLQAALEDAVQALFPPNSLVADTRATWQLDYSHELSSGDTSTGDNPSIRVRLPVALYRDAPWVGIAEALAGAGKEWIDTHQPASDGASWIFNVVLKSGLESEGLSLFNADLSYGIAKQTDAAAHQ